jgi:glycerol-3-phosphate acyltransferase PlsY
MAWIIIALLSSYLIGSIPCAYIFGRLLKGIDIRKFGSGNVGATNAMRVLGVGPGITILFLDILKGYIVVTVLADFYVWRIPNLSEEVLRVILGLSCIIGHSWTVFLRFKGGKGVATTLGVLLGLAVKMGSLKVVLGLSILTWLIIFIISRIVSIASVLAAIALPIYMILFRESNILVFTSLIISTFIILRHTSNLKRIIQGKEPRSTFKKLL